MVVWLNGTLTETPALDPADRGFTLGDGLFETLRLRDGRPCHMDRHLARLHRGTAVLRLPIPYEDTTLTEAITVLATAAGVADGLARLTVSRGIGPRGVLPPVKPRPTVLITAAPTGPAPPAPARLIIATVTRRNEHSPLAGIKSLNYLDNILARQEAADRGCDDAVLLNTAGRVAETTIANLVVQLDGRLFTPPLCDGALPGIARALILQGCPEVSEAPLTPDDLRRADAMVLTNSAGMRPVAELEGKALGNGGTEVAWMLERVTV